MLTKQWFKMLLMVILLKKTRWNECRPEKIPNSVLDENVDVHLVCPYFTDDAWLIVEDIVKRKTKSTTWICHSCNHDLHTQASIICESCFFGVRESQHSQKRRTGFVILVLSSYSVDYHTCCISVTAR